MRGRARHGQAWRGAHRGVAGTKGVHPVGTLSGRGASEAAKRQHITGTAKSKKPDCIVISATCSERGAVHVFRLRSGFIPYLPPFQGALIFFLCGLCTNIAHINVRCGFVTNFGLQYDNSPFAGCNKECNRASFPQKFHSFAAGLQAHAVGPRRQSSRTNK